MKRKLLILCACLFGVITGVKAWTSVVPYNGRSYYLYNIGENKYWYGTSGEYGTTDNIADATPVNVEYVSANNFKLAFEYGGTTYRIYQDDGERRCNNTTGVEFWLSGSTGGYELRSHNGGNSDRVMNSGGWFPKTSDSKKGNITWQFISVYEVNSGTAAECASTAEASYLSAANGWERVSNNTVLDESVDDYFFAVVCANYPGIMVNMANGNASQQAGGGYTSSKSMWYSNSANPEADNSFLWMIEKCNESGYEGYTFRNAIYPSLTIQAEGNASYYAHTHDQPNPCRWSSYALTPTDGVYTIKTLANGGDNYLGLWTPSNDYINGQELAGNRGAEEQGKFLIYRKLKNNTNMTSRITNPTFDSNKNGWTATGGFSNDKIASNLTGDFTGNFWENWNGSAKVNKMHQDLTNMPNGFYKLKIAAYVNNLAENNSTQYVFANSGKTYLVTNSPKYYEVWTEVTDNTLSIGLEQTTATANWMAIDNVSLTYSSSLPESVTPISGKMNAAVEAAQTSAVEAYATSRTIGNINTAMKAKAAAEVSKAAYANAQTYLEKVEDVLATTNFYTTAAYNTVYGTYKTAYDAGTLEDATAAGLSYKVAGSGGTARYDANTANDLLIPGWTIGGNDATISGSGFYINTWSSEGNSDGSNVTTPFYEYWTADGNALVAKNLVANISGYKANTNYRVSALVRVRQQNGESKADDDLTFKVGSGAAVNAADGTQSSSQSYTSMYYKTVIATGSSDAEGNLTVTFSVKDGNHISWAAFKDITVEELASDREVNLLFNADFEEPYTVYASSGVTSDRAIYVPNGWTIKGTFNTNDMTIFNSGDKASSNFSSITALPTGGNNTFLYRGKWGTDTNFDVYQNITLPAGTYKLSCDGWKSGLGGDGVIFAGDNTASLSGNETSWRPLSLEFTLNEETTLNVGFRVIHNNNGYEKFIGFDNFGLYTVNKVDEGEAYTPVDKAAHIVIVKRTIKDGVNTVVFPFSMTQEEVEAYFGAGSVVYQLGSYDNGTIHFTTKEGISANKPCLVKATSTTNSAINYELMDRTLVSGTPESVGVNVTMTGTYDAVTTIAQGNYIVKNDMLYVVDSDNVKMRNTRAYITLGTPSPARLVISFDDEDPTAINAIEAEDAEDGALKDGKYLIDGKIVIVKNGVKYGTNGQKWN